MNEITHVFTQHWEMLLITIVFCVVVMWWITSTGLHGKTTKKEEHKFWRDDTKLGQ